MEQLCISNWLSDLFSVVELFLNFTVFVPEMYEVTLFLFFLTWLFRKLTKCRQALLYVGRENGVFVML